MNITKTIDITEKVTTTINITEKEIIELLENAAVLHKIRIARAALWKIHDDIDALTAFFQDNPTPLNEVLNELQWFICETKAKVKHESFGEFMQKVCSFAVEEQLTKDAYVSLYPAYDFGGKKATMIYNAYHNNWTPEYTAQQIWEFNDE